MRRIGRSTACATVTIVRAETGAARSLGSPLLATVRRGEAADDDGTLGLPGTRAEAARSIARTDEASTSSSFGCVRARDSSNLVTAVFLPAIAVASSGASPVPQRASASAMIDCVMAALGACSISGTPLLRTSTITR